LLGNGDVAPGECEVVIGGKEGDQAKGEAADRLGETEAIEAGPRRGCCWQFWRNRRLLAVGWRPGGAGGRGHGAGCSAERGEALLPSMPPLSQHCWDGPRGIAYPHLPVTQACSGRSSASENERST
jgi:hypothetical protein